MRFVVGRERLVEIMRVVEVAENTVWYCRVSESRSSGMGDGTRAVSERCAHAE